MTHDTAQLRDDEWRSTIPPAEACTEVGDNYDDAAPEGAAIAVGFWMLCAALVVALALVVVL